MKFIADVNIAQKAIGLLRKSGHDVIDIKKSTPTVSDTNIIKLATKENRIILTHDKDFLGFSKFPKYQVGIIVIRLSIQNVSHHYNKLKEALAEKSEDVFISSLTIIYEESVKIFPYKAK